MINLRLVEESDMKVGRKRKKVSDISKANGKGGFRSEKIEPKILTKKGKKEKEDLIEKLDLKGKKHIEIKKTIMIPIHYDTTKAKIDILDRLTARLTYGMRLISSEIVNDIVEDNQKNEFGNIDDIDDVLKISVIEEMINDSDIAERTGLSSGFIQQCRDKVIWTWRSWDESYKEWKEKVSKAEDRLDRSMDDKEREKAEKWLEKLRKREPSKPTFENKTSCRFDYRTGNLTKWDDGKLSKLWIRISTLEKYQKIDIPLNHSQYHINQLKDSVIDDFEIIKGGNSRKKKNKDKYYIHVTITKVIEEKPINSVGGIDQGLNKSIAAVLLSLDWDGRRYGRAIPREEQLLDSAKVELLEKYDDIVSSLQEDEKWKKLRSLRLKRENVSIYHDWVLANKVAEFTEGAYVAIGNSKFRQSQYRGNEMPKLRKRVGKWSYGRQRKFIELKRSEMGYRTELRDEYGSSKECHLCHSKLIIRIFGDEYSYILCHSCGAKIDADINAGYIIATRCRDDMLKAGMITMKNGVSLQDGSLTTLANSSHGSDRCLARGSSRLLEQMLKNMKNL